MNRAHDGHAEYLTGLGAFHFEVPGLDLSCQKLCTFLLRLFCFLRTLMEYLSFNEAHQPSTAPWNTQAVGGKGKINGLPEALNVPKTRRCSQQDFNGYRYMI